jgi:hypothetical protein
MNNYKVDFKCKVCNNICNELLNLNKQLLANEYHNNIILDEYPLKIIYCKNCLCTIKYYCKPIHQP